MVLYTQGAPVTTHRFALLLKFLEQGACIQMLDRLAGVGLADAGIVKIQTDLATVYDTTTTPGDTSITTTEANAACATPAGRADFWLFFN